jgi:uncharacterized protein YabN with tetrapyrrole methylase and pyrophosphatase domain
MKLPIGSMFSQKSKFQTSAHSERAMRHVGDSIFFLVNTMHPYNVHTKLQRLAITLISTKTRRSFLRCDQNSP